MFFKSFNKAPKHNRFDFQPRYYNPDEEKRKARTEDPKERIRFQKGNLYRNAKSPIVGAFTDRREFDYRARARGKQKQVIRIAIIVGVLLLLFAMSLPKLEGILERIIS